MERKDSRQFQRFGASIPCAVTWQDEVIRGEVTNLSHGGALITQANHIPAERTQVIVVFQAGQEEIRFKARVREALKKDQLPSSFGIEFTETEQKVQSKLIRLVDALLQIDIEKEASED